ncbi:hypothetical protein [Nocardioides sp. URHA0032]|uniref:hypothetical protein n=1 Tax=Nocardioides sp. URHA0032 TaxID=1380388 RepID=UPI000B1DA1BC|nr:hypothetical protein [Nocardioides sp. URHA0032]
MKRAPVSMLTGLAAAAAVLSTTVPAPSADAATGHSRTAASTSAAANADAAGKVAAKKIIGMSAPADLWGKRTHEVGACGISARRIFASLRPDGRAQASVIGQAVAAHQMPVVSYKVPSVDMLIHGGYDSWLRATHRYLAHFGVPVTATFWHEPYGNMAPAKFRAGSRKFLDIFKTGKTPKVKVGPILNGWLLDNKVPAFASFTSRSLLRRWDFVAVDSYQSGTFSAPGDLLPARAVPLLARWMQRRGFGHKPIGLGEYNGFTAAAIKVAGEAILSTPEAWFGLAWNSSSGTKYAPLAGKRITKFKKTKADARAVHRSGC